MCPRTREKSEQIRESKYRLILDAAIECFATTGYHAVTISVLAAHAGISKGLMYHYFSSKDELLKSIFREILSEMVQLFDPYHTNVMDQKSLLQYFDRLFTHLKSNLIYWKMYMAIFSQPAVQLILRDEIQDSSKKMLEMGEAYFIKVGHKNPELEVAFLSTLISGAIYEYIADPENYPLGQIKERIISFYINS